MGHSVVIDMNTCTKCKKCVDVCFVNVFKWDEVKNAPIAAYPHECQICCLCEIQCPMKAITVIPDWSSRHSPRVLMRPKR